MDDPILVTGIVAAVCAWAAFVLLMVFVRWIARREVRRAIKALRESKFVMVHRDKQGRYTR